MKRVLVNHWLLIYVLIMLFFSAILKDDKDDDNLIFLILMFSENTINRNMKTIHTTIVQDHLRPINKLLNRPPPDIDKKWGNLTPLYPTQTFPTQDKQIPSPHDLPTQNRPCQPPSSKLSTLQRPKP